MDVRADEGVDVGADEGGVHVGADVNGIVGVDEDWVGMWVGCGCEWECRCR